MIPECADNFLIQKCHRCKNTLVIDDGTMLYDGKWYHKKCWNSMSTENTSKEFDLNLRLAGFAELFEQLYQSSPDMYRIVNKDGIITLCNDAYAKYLGYSVDEVIGKSIFEHIAKESVLAMHDSFETWKNTGVVKNREVWFQRKDNTVFLGLVSANNICDKSGNWVGSNTVIRDITEIYHARKEIEEREAKIRTDFQELKKVNLLKDEFLAMITHELKTPLVPIKCYTELLLSEQFGSLNNVQKQKLEMIMTSASSLVGLISDLLDAQKIELGKLKLYVARNNLAKIIEESIMKMSPIASCAKIAISTNLENDMWCMCDSARIEQVFNNVIANAMKFVKPNTGKIQVRLYSSGSDAVIVVKDNGVGIPQDQLDKVFLKFYQVSSTNTREHNGTGLGLAICKGLIESHEGKIWATSDGIGSGTEIHIMLPLVK